MAFLTLTQTGNGSTFVLDEGNLIEAIAEGAGSEVSYITKNDGKVEKIIVDEAPSAIGAASSDIFGLILRDGAGTVYINVNRVSTFEDDSESKAVVKYDAEGASVKTYLAEATSADLKASLTLAQGPYVYKALLSQDGIFPPVAVVIENTFPEPVAWTRYTVGGYRLVAGSSLFPEDKTAVLHNNAGISDDVMVKAYWESDTRIYYDVTDGGVRGDDLFDDGHHYIEIRVYP